MQAGLRTSSADGDRVGAAGAGRVACVGECQSNAGVPGKRQGSGECIVRTGSPVLLDVSGNTIKFAALASTRMACADNAVSSQATEYLKALGAAKRFEWKEPTLLIYAEGYGKPLRFTRVTTAKP